MSLTFAETCTPNFEVTQEAEKTVGAGIDQKTWETHTSVSEISPSPDNQTVLAATGISVTQTDSQANSITRDWCLGTLTIVSSLADQVWYSYNAFSYTYPHWSTSPSCDDLLSPPNMSYEFTEICVLDDLGAEFICASSVSLLDTSLAGDFAQRLIVSSSDPDDSHVGIVYSVKIGALLSSAQSLESSFKITIQDPCETLLPPTTPAPQTYTIGEPLIEITIPDY